MDASPPADTIEPITVLGVDQSTTATGLCVIKWHPVSGPDVLCARTVKPSDINKLGFVLSELMGYLSNRPVAMAREQGFFSAKTPEAGLAIERAGGWVEALMHWTASTYQFTVPAMYRVMAIEWRRVVWGGDFSKLPAQAAKDYSVRFAVEHFRRSTTLVSLQTPERPSEQNVNHHIADAFGIACWGAQKHYNKTGGSRSDAEATTSSVHD